MTPNRKRAGYDYPTDWAEAERLETLRRAQRAHRHAIPVWEACLGWAAVIFALCVITGVF